MEYGIWPGARTISQDGAEIAFGDVTGSIYLDIAKGQKHLFKCNVACGMMHFTKDNEALVCGYLPYRIEDDLGYGQYGWVWYRNPVFIFPPFQAPFLPQQEFVLWPIESKTQAMEYFVDDGLLLDGVKNVSSVFPSLVTGFYKWIGYGTAFVSLEQHLFHATVRTNC